MNDKQPRVFVVHESMNMNYSDAERFGEVRFVTNREWNPRRGSLSNDQTFEAIDRCLEEFDLRTDYVVFNGPPVIIGYAFHRLMATPRFRGFDLKVLTWDKRHNKYIEGHVPNRP